MRKDEEKEEKEKEEEREEEERPLCCGGADWERVDGADGWNKRMERSDPQVGVPFGLFPPFFLFLSLFSLPFRPFPFFPFSLFFPVHL